MLKKIAQVPMTQSSRALLDACASRGLRVVEDGLARRDGRPWVKLIDVQTGTVLVRFFGVSQALQWLDARTS